MMSSEAMMRAFGQLRRRIAAGARTAMAAMAGAGGGAGAGGAGGQLPDAGARRSPRRSQDLHVFIMWICVVIFVAVFGVMFYSIFKHRKSVGHRPRSSTRTRRSR